MFNKWSQLLLLFMFIFSFSRHIKVKFDPFIITELQLFNASKSTIGTQCSCTETNKRRRRKCFSLMNPPPPLNSQEIIWWVSVGKAKSWRIIILQETYSSLESMLYSWHTLSENFVKHAHVSSIASFSFREKRRHLAL